MPPNTQRASFNSRSYQLPANNNVSRPHSKDVLNDDNRLSSKETAEMTAAVETELNARAPAFRPSLDRNAPEQPPSRSPLLNRPRIISTENDLRMPPNNDNGNA